MENQNLNNDIINDIDLICIICRDPYYHPILTPCGHHFCKECLINHIRINTPNCPQCKALFDKFYTISYIKTLKHDFFLANLSRSKLSQYCKNKDKGCKMMYLPQEEDIHIKLCKYEEVSCKNYFNGCRQLIPRIEIYHHENICEYSKCIGSRYGCYYIGNKTSIEDHKDDCLYYNIGSKIETNLIKRFTIYSDILVKDKVNLLEIKNRRTQLQINGIKEEISSLTQSLNNLEENYYGSSSHTQPSAQPQPQSHPQTQPQSHPQTQPHPRARLTIRPATASVDNITNLVNQLSNLSSNTAIV